MISNNIFIQTMGWEGKKQHGSAEGKSKQKHKDWKEGKGEAYKERDKGI